MRGIKFRGKSIKGFGNNLIGTWFYGGIIINPHGNEVHIAYFDKDMFSWHNVPVDPKTVGQFISIKDKNSKEIYEGDIVAISGGANNGHNGFIVYDDEKACYKAKGNFLVQYLDQFEDIEFEVIGNIYDNPELLK